MGESVNKRDYIRGVLTWVGSLVTVISVIFYIGITVVLVEGFEVEADSNNLLIFSILGAVSGLLIANSLRIQGVALAKSLPEVQELLKRFSKQSSIKHRPIGFYMTIHFIFDLFSKALTVGVSTYFVINLFINGLGDDKYIYLAITNTLLFVGFGLIALVKTYDYYLEHHVAYLEQKLKKDLASRSVDSIENELERK